MSEPRYDDLDGALRDGLRRQEVPEASPDFDERVLAAVRRRHGWRALWPSLRPAMAAGTLSMVVMLGLIHWGVNAPSELPVASGAVSQTAPPMDIDRLLDDPNAIRRGLYAWKLAPRPVAPAVPDDERRSCASLPLV